VLWFAALFACSVATDTAVAPPVSPPEPAEVAAPIEPVDPTRLTLRVDDLGTLKHLDGEGRGHWSLNGVLARATGAETVAPNTSAMRADNPGFRVNWPAGNVGRNFDVRWLDSPSARFDLVSVVNRVDRHDVTGAAEVRLIYRLAYSIAGADGTTRGSRLPFTVNVVLRSTDPDARTAAARWLDLPDEAMARAARIRNVLDSAALHTIELNAQVVRFPSGLETEFAGQAVYLLLVLKMERDGAGWTARPQPLENTPDVRRLSADETLRVELEQWILGNVDAVDLGVFQIPDRFLARRALSWSTLGMNRADNKPFEAVFGTEWAVALPDGERRFFRDGRGLLERLDNSSCIGCHQAGSTAGFHTLGLDDPDTAGVTNRLRLPVSPHAQHDLERRRTWLTAVLEGREPDRYRPHSLHPNQPYSAAKGTCIPDSARSSLTAQAGWGCAEGTTCRVLAADPNAALAVGMCVVDPEREDAETALSAGQACREGQIASPRGNPRGDQTFNAHGYAARFAQEPLYPGLPEDKTFSADTFNCRPTVIGVPLGRAYRRCTAEERKLSADPAAFPDEICAVVGGSKFDQCVEGDFHTCLAGIVARGMVDTCSAQRPCREDYICQTLPWQLDSVPSAEGKALSEAGIGFCTPTYFLFQLRLDGHPVPQ
jgi:hypothetical protein